MARLTDLRVRGDWQVVRLVYLPAAAIGLTPFEPCALCRFCYWWGHHIEEWARRKPLFRITDAGLRYEDGGRPVEYCWADIQGIALERRNRIPIWRTNGNTQIAGPPVWLSITIRERRQRTDKEEYRTICVWPRQVVGGLFSLMRFAKELQRHLIERANGGEIDRLLPEGSRMNRMMPPVE